MKILDGFFRTYHIDKFVSPKGIKIYLDYCRINIRMSNHRTHWEFRFSADNENDNLGEEIICHFTEAINYLFDTIYCSYSNQFNINSKKFSPYANNKYINYIYTTTEYGSKEGHLVDISYEKKGKIAVPNLVDLTRKLHQSKELNSALNEYLKSMEEPQYFLPCIYKASEYIKKVFVNEKDFILKLDLNKNNYKKMTKIANNPDLYNSRHAGSVTSKRRSMNREEHDHCKKEIRNIINKFTNYL